MKKKNDTGLRLLAVILWLLAFAMEIFVVPAFQGKLQLLPGLENWLKGAIALLLDLIFLVAGSMCWKNANRRNPATLKEKKKFFWWNYLGLIAASGCFVPFVLLVLMDKKAEKKAKGWAALAAVLGAAAIAAGIFLL